MNYKSQKFMNVRLSTFETTADVYQTGSSLNVLLFTVLEDALSGRGGYALPRAEAALPHTPHVPHAANAEAAAAAHHRALEAEAETNTKAARSSVYNLQSLGGGEWSSAHDSYRTAFMTALMTVQ